MESLRVGYTCLRVEYRITRPKNSTKNKELFFSHLIDLILYNPLPVITRATLPKTYIQCASVRSCSKANCEQLLKLLIKLLKKLYIFINI